MTTKVWVLTREHNDYDQYGEYFEAVWTKQPTIQKLAEYFVGHEHGHGTGDIMQTVEFLEHLRNGGGRRGTEDTWYNLNHVETL